MGNGLGNIKWATYGLWSVMVQACETIFVSPPGEGKTAWAEGLAKAMGATFIELVAAHNEPGDIQGIHVPDWDEGRMTQLLSKYAWLAKQAQDKGQMVFIFMDEFMRAVDAKRAACLKIMSERRIGEYQLVPELTMIGLAGNPQGTGVSSGWDSADANRCARIEFEDETDNFIDGLTMGWDHACRYPVLPDNWLDGVEDAKTYVAAYLHTFPEDKRVFPATKDQQRMPWPSKRTWERHVVRFLAAMNSVEPDRATDPAGHKAWSAARVKGVTCCIGKETGLKFNSFIENLDLPTMEEIEEAITAGSIEMPNRGDKVMAVSTMIYRAVAKASSSHTKDEYKARWIQGLELLIHAKEQGNGDIVSRTGVQYFNLKPTGLRTPVHLAKPFNDMIEIKKALVAER